MEVQHVLTAAPFTPENLQPIFQRAQELQELDRNPTARRLHAGRFIGKRAVNLFYQPSTRTRISFEMAQVAWGMGYSSTENAKEFSSAAKGETLEHTLKVVQEYRPDMIVIRHDEKGEVEATASHIDMPVINAGDGSGEHPTQAIGDAATIQKHLHTLDNLTVTFMGDLRYGRTIRSLVHILLKSRMNHFNFISDPALTLSDDIRQLIESMPYRFSYKEYTDMDDIEMVLNGTDVWYVTRTQKDQAKEGIELETPPGTFRVTSEYADMLPGQAVILHPMPIDRSDPLLSEIAPEVDHHPRARWYDQSGIVFYTRMAGIERLMRGEPFLAEAA